MTGALGEEPPAPRPCSGRGLMCEMPRGQGRPGYGWLGAEEGSGRLSLRSLWNALDSRLQGVGTGRRVELSTLSPSVLIYRCTQGQGQQWAPPLIILSGV